MEIPGYCRWPSRFFGEVRPTGLTRRVFALSALSALGRAQKPEISSFDLSLFDELSVPSDLFFVREHFPAPNLSSAGWILSLSGAVANPLEISYEEISAARRLLPVTIECAENPVGGGLVSHAEWTGLSLASLLQRGGPSAEARFVRLSGADGFSRAIPLAKAMHPDSLIAYAMNGEKLPLNHGLPLRAIVPGWYGMASVKWLRRIDVLPAEDPPRDYMRQVRSLLAGVRPTDAVTAIQVKSAFSRPLDGAILIGRRFLLRGLAWAGEQRVRQVEVSVDGAKSWRPAMLTSAPRSYAWLEWTYDWKIPAAGAYELAVRAADESGRKQPAERAAQRADAYELDTPQTIRITVT
jgi:DMSO/TMAO reductase YedYZ molybdopterin-dependent catalytic subunit